MNGASRTATFYVKLHLAPEQVGYREGRAIDFQLLNQT